MLYVMIIYVCVCVCVCCIDWGTVHWHFAGRGLVSYYPIIYVVCNNIYIYIYICAVSIGEQSTGVLLVDGL